MPRRPLDRTAEDRAEEAEFFATYGRWEPLTPREMAAELADFDRPWWVVGGWAIEAATGVLREHEDLDVSLLACDVPALVQHLAGRWHVWNNTGGVLRPLGGRFAHPLADPASQLWLRADAVSPWVVDIPLTPDDDGWWTHKFLPDRRAAVEDVTWVAEDGVRYLRPEIVLSYKARWQRPKDELDLATCLPRLDPAARAWLRTAVGQLDPPHPWLDRL